MQMFGLSHQSQVEKNYQEVNERFFKGVRVTITLLLVSYLFSGCEFLSEKINGKTLFTSMPASYTGIRFSNDLKYSDQLNPLTYHNFYNGGGVAVGDINNDGLPDLFFCGNMVANKLYLNRGNFQFEDISAKSQISSDGFWYSGVTFVDINADGLLDIYVCKARDFLVGWRGNELYINNGDLTFTERAAEYGLAVEGFSTHCVFFDFDNDGDLDSYLLSNSNRSGEQLYPIKDQRKIPATKGGNKLFRNDNNHFVDVTAEAGIYGSEIGFGLGVSVADINKDGWQDIYVSNDFFERDYLYLNKGNGTFVECLEKFINEISMFSMGADIGDINNDGYPEIYVTDMLPELESRVKTKTNFEDWNKYQSNLSKGYHQQFIRNVLQLNRGPFAEHTMNSPEFHFSEISRLAGVQATDWSWGALMADLNNDGFKDIFVSNGMFKDVTDQDFIQFIANDSLFMRKTSLTELMDIWPSQPLSNYAFLNNGDLTFTNKAKEWGLGIPGFSNGSAYADLDNDGDLDIITNNVNKVASIYRNNTCQVLPQNKYLKIVLSGDGNNKLGLGTKVTVYYNNTLSYLEQMPSRGFQSCVDHRLNFGLGDIQLIDSILVEWPGGEIQLLKNVAPNQTVVVKQSESLFPVYQAHTDKGSKIFSRIMDNVGIDFIHKEDDYIDFNKDKLIYQMLSTLGPRVAVGDVNGDGLDDLYFCGAKDQAGTLFIQTNSGIFKRKGQPAFEADSKSEDTDCLFFDVDGDRDNDLFVCSGGGVYSDDSSALRNRLYFNDGDGNFTKSKQLPLLANVENSSTVSAGDFDSDGDLDLFIGARLIPNQYGYPCSGIILQNDSKGIFVDVTFLIAPELKQVGMVTDSEWFDYDKDGKLDLVIVGEFMPIRIFHNEGNTFKDVTSKVGLVASNGWWNRLAIGDFNHDGFPDIIAGNAGLNSRFKATDKKPVSMYAGDFDSNGTIEQIMCTFNGEVQYPMVLRHDLVSVLPSLKKKYLKYEDYKEKTMADIFSPTQLERALKLDAYQLNTSLFLNNSKGGFELKTLPIEAQFSPVYAILVKDYDHDGIEDILLGGNFYQAKPEIGIQDASYGLLLIGDGLGGFVNKPIAQSNFFVKGAIRDMATINLKNRQLIVIAKNNDKVEVVEFNYSMDQIQ